MPYMIQCESADGTIVLQYMPHELIGNYFTAV